MKSRFLDLAAHELRTPVTGLSLALQFAQMELKTQGRPVDLPTLEKLRTQVSRLSRLTVELLEMARLNRGELKLQAAPTNLLSIISECLHIFRLQSPTRSFTLSEPKQPIELNLDRDRIFQVLSSLLDNAIKYTPASTSIEVAVETTPDIVRVLVKDHGPGIEDQLQALLFNSFERGVLGSGCFFVAELSNFMAARLDLKANRVRGVLGE